MSNANLMREVKLYDDHHEREQMENMSELFAVLSALESLEKMFSKDQVTADDYKTECFKLLDHYKVRIIFLPFLFQYSSFFLFLIYSQGCDAISTWNRG